MADLEAADANNASSTLPRSAKRCRIPRLNRSVSVRTKSNDTNRLDVLKSESRPKSLTMGSRDYPWQLLGSMTSMPFDEDGCSVKSFGSYASYASFASQSQCGTEASSRPMSRAYYGGKKYVLHCDRHLAKQEEYLTPTQRKEREVRQLKTALARQTKGCEAKDAEIEALKEELQRLRETVAELQLGKHDLMHSSQESDDAKNSSVISFESNESSDLQTVAHHNDDSGISNVMSISMSPRNSSEEFDDLDDHRLPSEKVVPTADKAVGTEPSAESSSETTSDFDRFLGTYKQELDQLKSQHKEHYQDLKERFNDRVDDLLQKLSEANSRYLELRPMFDRAQDKIHTIESQLSEVQKDMETQEDYHNQMYLKMYRKGQEAARFEDDGLDFGLQSPPTSTSSIPELLRQLQQLESELQQTRQLYREACRGAGDRQAEYTLRFLKDAVFYFLTKKDKEHLKAIQSILGFTDAERMAVAKAMKHRRL